MTDFDSIYLEYRPRIHRYLCSLCGEPHADDLTQEVFVKVNGGLDSFRGEASLSTWIYRIATNTAHDHAASSRRRQQNELQFGDNGSADDFADGNATDTDEEFIRREMNACIRGIVDQLPENYRTVLVLSDFEYLSNADIARILDTSIEIVKIRLHRARAFLRKALECQCSFYHDGRNQLMCDRKN